MYVVCSVYLGRERERDYNLIMRCYLNSSLGNECNLINVIVHCTVYNEHSLQCTMNTVHCTVWTMYTVYSIHCICIYCTVYSFINYIYTQTHYTVQCTLYSIHRTLFILHLTLHCTLYSIDCTLYTDFNHNIYTIAPQYYVIYTCSYFFNSTR